MVNGNLFCRPLREWIFIILLSVQALLPGAVLRGESGIVTVMPVSESLDGISDPDSLEISANMQGKPHRTALWGFDLGSLPRSKISAATLVLTARNGTSNGKYSLKLIPVTQDNKELDRIGSIGVKANWPKKDEHATGDIDPSLLQEAREKHDPFRLKIQTETRGVARVWYSGKANESGYRPRLIIEYDDPSKPAVYQASGIRDAESPRGFVDFETQNKFSWQLRPLQNAGSFAPAFYSERIYLMTDNKDKKELLVLDALGTPLCPAVPLPPAGSGGRNLGQYLLATANGRLLIVGDGRILVYAIDTEKPASEPKPLRDVQVPGLNPSVAPALGPDGALYVVNGQEVYGINPDLQELWKVTLADKKTGPVTVGPSGKFVYLSTRGEGLLAINAQTGAYQAVPLPNQEALLDLHAPVVIRHPDGGEKIYVAANSVNDGILACFDNRNAKGVKYDCPVAILDKSWELQGLWGQPIADLLPAGDPADSKKTNSIKANPAKKLYAIHVVGGKGTLEAIDWLAGKSVKVAENFSIDVGGSSDLLRGGNLVMDRDGNCFVWNGAGSDGLYAVRTASPSSTIDMKVDLPVKSRLFFGTDGTLYASGVDDRSLKALIPAYSLVSDTPVDLASTTHLMVDGTAKAATTLKAGGRVILGRGFTVRKGATLSISSGAAPGGR